MATVPIYDMADAWNNAGTTFNAIKMDVTDTASAAASKLLDIQLGGVSQFSVDKSGIVETANGTFLSDMAETWNNAGTQFTTFKLNVTNTASSTGSRLIDLQIDGVSYMNITKEGIVDFSGLPSGTVGINMGSRPIRSSAGRLFLQSNTDGPAGGGSNYLLSRDGQDYVFGLDNADRWAIQASVYHFFPSVDNAYDIGKATTNRVRNLYSAGGTVLLENLPTSDPVNAGQLYNDAGTLKVSAG